MIISILRSGRLLLLAGVIASMAPTGAAVATLRVVYNLQQYFQPAGLLEGAPGVFYSLAGSGVVFSVTSQGSATILGSFSTAFLLQSLLVSGPNRLFYSSVGSSNPLPTYDVFSVTSVPGGQKIYTAQSINPELTQNLPDGTLLGSGVDGSYLWHLIRSDLSGNITSLYQFPSSDRLENAIYANDGNYYGVIEPAVGTTAYVFRLTPSNSLTLLYTFPSNTFTSYLPTPLLKASDGNLYGATVTGGANGTGMVYRITSGGTFTLLHSFEQGPGVRGPASLIEASDGNLYGVYQANDGDGRIFRVTKSGRFTVVYDMNGADGLPPCWLIQGSDGIIYGTARAGGSTGSGTVFAFDAGLAKPQPQAQRFHPQGGAVGTQVRIWGYDLLAASVNFNGVPAPTVSNSGSNYVWATVPIGATTGPITVTTPGGTTTTHTTFTVQ